MDEDTDQNTDPGLLSPRRIEAIHIAFNKVFDSARKEGLIRDAKSYRSFDEVFEIAMKIKEGEVSVEDVVISNHRSRSIEKDPMGNWDGEGMMIDDGGWEGGMDEGGVSMDMGGAGGFSDEDNGFGNGMGMGMGEESMDVEVMETNRQQKKDHHQRKRNPSKRKLDHVDGTPPLSLHLFSPPFQV